jgi:predicted transcriptional regulator
MTLTNPRLGVLEQAVLDQIWKAGPQTADQIRRSVTPERQLSDSTIRTVLRRLEHKGLVGRELLGKRYLYRGMKERRNLAMEALRALMDRFFSGSVDSLLTGMVEEEIIGPRELARLQKELRVAEKRRLK